MMDRIMPAMLAVCGLGMVPAAPLFLAGMPYLEPASPYILVGVGCLVLLIAGVIHPRYRR